MKSYPKFAMLILTVSSLLACKKDKQDPLPTQLLQDSNITDSTFTWFFNYGYYNSNNPNQYRHSFSKESVASAPYALKISSQAVKDTSAFCNWGQVIVPPYLPVGTKLTLKAKVKLENVTGPGVSLAIRGDKIGANNQRDVVFFQSTEKVTTITGTSDFKEYTVVLDSYPDNVDELYVFLVYLNNTTGTVYFDDITLTVN